MDTKNSHPSSLPQPEVPFPSLESSREPTGRSKEKGPTRQKVILYTMYALLEPNTTNVRYVGCTVNPKERMYNHKTAVRYRSDPVALWVADLLQRGLSPQVIILEETPDQTREAFWIAHYKHLGHSLTNLSAGGAGNPGWTHPEDVREKIRISTKNLWQNSAYREKRGAASKAMWQSDNDRRERMLAPLRAGVPVECRPTGDRNGLRKPPAAVARGERSPNAKMTDERVRVARRMYANHEANLPQLAAMFNVTTTTMWKVLTRKSWKHVIP